MGKNSGGRPAGTRQVGGVTDIEKEGTKPLDQVETEIRFAVTKEKKAEQLSNKLSSSGSTLSEIASALGKTVSKATNLKSTNAQIPGLGWESEVVFTALNLELDEISKPIKGNSGVFMIQLKSKTGVNPEQVSIYRRNITQEINSSLNQKLLDALKKDANIEDNRSRFF